MSALCLAFLVVLSVVNAEWAACVNGNNYHLSVSGVDVTPNPPQRNRDTAFKFSGSIDEKVTGGKITTTLTYNGYTMYTAQSNFCDQVSCPCNSGVLNPKFTLTLPAAALSPYAPGGDYVVKFDMTDQRSDALACVKYYFSLH